MLQESRTLISVRPNFFISFVKKQTNKLASILARVSYESITLKKFLLLCAGEYDVSLS